MAESLRLLKRFRAPVHCLPGNHDLRPAHLAEDLAAYRNAFGELSQRAEHQGVVFLMLYSEPMVRGFRVSGYDPWAWLEAELAAAGGKPVLLFMHRPLASDFYRNTMHAPIPDPGLDAWRQALRGGRVMAVIAGHFHRDELHWLGQLPVHACPPVAGFWGRQAAYRVYEYRDGQLGYRTQYVE